MTAPKPHHLLLSPRLHSEAISRTRALLIGSRVQQIAWLLAVLTIGWIPIDAILLPADSVLSLAIARVAAGMVLLFLARLSPDVVVTMPLAYQRLGALFAVPLGFLFFAIGVISDTGVQHDVYALDTAYLFAPYIIATGVSFFPLALIESALLLVAPITACMAFYVTLFDNISDGYSPYEVLWILILILTTAAMAAASQLGFLLKLFEDTALDALTGLFVRKIGEAVLGQQFSVAVRTSLPMSVVFLDIDHFKAINDRYGHDEGDEVIAAVAKKIRSIMRNQDIAIRWGGEEFVIALPNTNASQAESFLRRLGKGGLATTPDGKKVTASIGVAEWQAEEVPDWQTLTHRADQRLYAAKRAGRNCYVIGDEAHPWLD